MAEVACPFCGITSSEPLVIQAHLEENHAESWNEEKCDAALAEQLALSHGETEAGQISPPGGDEQWTKCTRPGCGEYVLLSDVDDHLDVHASLAASTIDPMSDRDSQGDVHQSKPTAAWQAKLEKARSSRPSDPPRKSGPTLLEYFSGSSYRGNAPPQRSNAVLPAGRLGRRELGPHAFEKQMPAHVRRHLLNDALPHQVNRLNKDGRLIRETIVDNETSGLVPLLAHLCASDRDVEAAYLCHPSVKHVAKLRCDGNFCGYWNIQMLLSFLQATGALPDMWRMPDVLLIQDTIEQAWQSGVLPYGRTETSGIHGTRKWIGTSEAVAYSTQLGVGVEALSFQDEEQELAAVALLDHVESYFIGGLEKAEQRGVSHITRLAPIFFQRLGHSMTIVGLQRNKDGSRQLLLFDPSFETSASIRAMLAGKRCRTELETLLRPYRRCDQSLARWEEFEIIAPRAAGGDQDVACLGHTIPYA